MLSFPAQSTDSGSYVWDDASSTADLQTKEEVQNILMHAKTLKSPYMRKCPQRPFESFMSILTLFPWANETAYHPSQVDLLFAV
jgi:hypothetical protein